jgi:hypothetical protein
MYHDAINRIYTFPVFCYNYNNNQKNYLNREIVFLNEVIRGISVSYYNSTIGQTDMAFLTIVNRKKETLLYNFPIVDLMDKTSAATPGNVVNNNFRLRCFNLVDVSTTGSYVMYNDIFTPVGDGLKLNINFYY